MTKTTTSQPPTFKSGDHIWNRTFPFVVGTGASIGTVPGRDAYMNVRPA